MSLLAFLIVCAAGAAIGLVDGDSGPASGRVGRLAGLGGLLAAMLAALFIDSTTRLSFADVTLAGSEYSGRFLACAAGSGLVLSLVALASGWSDRLAPAALASFAGLAVAVTAVDPGVALAAAAAATTAGAIVLGREVAGSDSDGRLAEMRTIGLVAAVFLGASLALSHPAWNGPSASPAFVLGFCGLGIGLAVRSGAVPFHVPAVRMGLSGGRFSPALLLVWIPAGLGIVTISWSATTFGMRSDWLDAAVAAAQVVAVATIVLGALAALVHDELEEIVTYSIVADAGFVLLALAARNEAAAEPARMWLLAFIAAKTGLVAWAAAVSRAFGTSKLGRLHGWLRRTPLLGLALLAVVIATLGWPGSPVSEARSTLVQLALPGGLQFVLPAAIILSLAYTGRLLIVGLLSPATEVAAARGEMPHWGSRAAATPEPASADETGAAAGNKAAATATGTDSGPSNASVSLPAATGGPNATSRLLQRLASVWQLNRTLEASLAVVVGASVAVAIAFGGFGTSDASQFGIPLDTAARATPTPPPPPTLAVTPTPEPTLAPHSTALPTNSPGPSQSAGPSTSAAPVKTAVPVHGPGN
jgi:formate hydrogenlyase subunit 3/multisubunit Na+/H+ antiporter MnhD subunit